MAYNRLFVFNAGPASSGLATVGYKILNSSFSTVVARTTTGVTEISTGSGSYGVLISVTAASQGCIFWDIASGSAVCASEDINPGGTTEISVPSGGTLGVNTTQLAGQTVSASAGVTFPSSVGTSTYAGGAVASVTAAVTVGTNNDKTGYSLSQTFPTNFSSLAITVGGAVTAGTVSDKTGYSLTQTFPSNFSTQSIDSSGRVLLQPTQTGVTIPTVTNLTNNNPTVGNVTVGAYAAGQDPATLVWAASVKAVTSIPNATVGGYATNQDPGTYVLFTPANKVRVDGSGNVQTSGGGGGTTVIVSYPTLVPQTTGDDSGEISIRRGDTIIFQLTGLGSLADRAALWITAKRRDLPDAQSDFQITENEGLIVIVSGLPMGSETGSLIVNDAAAGDVTVTLSAEAAALLSVLTLQFDVQIRFNSGVVRTLGIGSLIVTEDQTRATDTL